VGWDIEIAQEFPDGGERDWLALDPPLGISCAAAAWFGDVVEIVGFAPFGHDILPVADARTRQMSAAAARGIVQWLANAADAGRLIVTWNGLGFDFPVLARACRDDFYTRAVADLALRSCDLGFAMLCDRGYMIGLDTAAKALGLAGKLPGMDGKLAPLLWNAPDRPLTDGEREALDALRVEPGSIHARRLCVDYVKQDARTTAEVYEALMRERSLIWRTKAGTLARQPWRPYVVDDHIATCREALTLPAPDVSWMSNPRPRSAYAGWAEAALSS
jgi:hypothetical protein